MFCILCFHKTNFKKLIEIDDILNLTKFHFAWIEPQENDVLCRRCWKILEDFNNYCKEINDIQKKNALQKVLEENKSINNIEVNSVKSEMEDVIELFRESNDFFKINCSVDNPIEDDHSSNSIDELPVLEIKQVEKPVPKLLAKTKYKKSTSKNSNQAKMKYDEASDKLISSFMKLKCYICSINLDKFSELKRHFKTEHNIQNGYMQCCTVRLYKRAQLVDHLNCCHLNPEQLRCTICSKILSSSYCLKVHMRNCHSDIRRNKSIYTCKECNENFDYHISYHRHLATHIPVNEWKFKCENESCNKTFATNTLLKNHARAHKMKICAECGKVVLANLYSDHLSTHSDKVALACDICHKFFKTKRYLNVHKSKHLDADKIHQCPTCGKISPNSKALKKHISYVHKEVKLHKCNICNKTFKRLYVLKQHLGVHTGQPIYNCNYCDRTFYWDSHFHAHRKSAHPIEFKNEQAKTKAKRTNFNEFNLFTKN